MNTRLLYLALLLVSFHTVAHAQFFKCKDANDRYTIQDTPCAADPSAQERKRPKPGERDESAAQRQKDNAPGANWGTRPQTAQEARTNPPQPTAAIQANAPKSSAPASTGDSWQEKDREFQKRRTEEQTKAKNAQASAANQMRDCSNARQQLGVLKESRPVYSRDNKGEKQYLNDDNRQAALAAAEQRVAKACN